jgi:hypothetical protein
MYFIWTPSWVHQAMHMAGISHDSLALVFYPITAYQGHFLVSIGNVNMVYLEKH